MLSHKKQRRKKAEDVGVCVRLYFVDGELALEATAIALVQRDLHGVVYESDLMTPHLILNVQPHHWDGQRSVEEDEEEEEEEEGGTGGETRTTKVTFCKMPRCVEYSISSDIDRWEKKTKRQ